MKQIGAGQRRHRITILKRAVIPIAGSIENQITYTPIGTRWASIEPLSARELLLAQQSQIYAETTHRITMLWTAELKSKDQLNYQGRIFELVGNPIDKEELKREMVCMAVERT